MPREIGMPFRDDMVAALRNGTKTQHRVLIEPQPPVDTEAVGLIICSTDKREVGR